MRRFSCFISSFGCNIKLVVNGSQLFYQALLTDRFWQEFVPGLSFDNSSQSNDIWTINEAEELKYLEAQRTIEAALVDIKKIIVIIESAFEVLRQQEHKYTMHGAVIEKSGCAVALIGNVSGIGKTTLASFAADKGWSWLIDEKFTIYKSKMIGGTKNILNDDKTRASAGTNSPKPGEPYRLRLICQPVVTGGVSVSRFDMTYEKSLWTLYGEVTRDIRQVDGVIKKDRLILQSLDTEELARSRLNNIENLAKDTPVVFVSGPKYLLLKEIESILWQSQ